MTSLLTTTPLDPEPLPLYSCRDPDTLSIRSAAPSYVSDTPSYTSYRTPTSLLPPLLPHQEVQARGRGLPAAHYAPGFQSRARSSVADINLNHFNPGNWSSPRSSNNSRQYNAVARRRANMARENSETTALLNSLSAVPPPSCSPPAGQTGSAAAAAAATTTSAYPVQVGSSAEPLNPHEDPYLVGEEAAARARAQRVYREMCLKGDEARGHEGRSWDFMVGQMADWEERRRSWKGFRKSGGQGVGNGSWGAGYKGFGRG